jgi:hypothetical protein
VRRKAVTLWERQQYDNPIVQLALESGLQGAARQLNISDDEMAYQIERAHYLADFPYFAEKRLWIEPKSGPICRFRLNTPQRKLSEARDRQRAKGKPVRIRMLKARQWGGSTETQGWIFQDTILNPSRRSMTVAHSIESATHLRDMSERYYNRYDERKPPFKISTDKTWKFQHSIEKKLAPSLMRIDTADNLGAGHSMTSNNLHASEIQLWKHADTILRGLLPMIPETPDTMILEEGTGSGVGDYWYELVEEARSGLTEWEFVFVPWFDLDDTLMPVEEKFAFEKSLDSEEKRLVEMGLSLERLAWRRYQLLNKYKGDPDGFRQQYPSDPDEAFLTSGRPVFHAETVKKRIQETESFTVKIGNFRWSGETVKFDEDPSGYWRLYEDPAKSSFNLYCWGADPVEGREIVPGLGLRGGDKAGVRLFRRDTRKFVGTLSARVDPDVLAEEIDKASRFFGGVPGLPELNAGGGGQLLIARLRERGVWMLKTPVLGKKRDERKEDRVGFETLQKSKRYLIDNMIPQVRDGEYTDPDKEAWQQCATYVREADGKTQAQSLKFDDLIMATALTLEADRLMPLVFGRTSKKKEVIPRDVDKPRKDEKSVSQEKVMEETLCEF